jgi:hypothetical protein
MDRIKVNVILSDKFSRKQREKVQTGVNMIRAIVNSSEFYLKVRDFKAPFPGEIGFHYDGNGIPDKLGKDVFAILEMGAESLSPTKDREIDALIDVGYGTAIGYTFVGSRWQWINSWFLNSAKPHDIAGNIFHEWSHKLGFSHSFNRHPKRDYTVPYALGYIMRDMAKKL